MYNLELIVCWQSLTKTPAPKYILMEVLNYMDKNNEFQKYPGLFASYNVTHGLSYKEKIS